MNAENRKFRLHDAQSGSAITVHITPRAARNAVVEILDDGTIKLQLVSLKKSSELDRALVVYLAEILEISPGKIDVVAGSGTNKLVTIMGLSADQVHKKILEAMNQNQ